MRWQVVPVWRVLELRKLYNVPWQRQSRHEPCCTPTVIPGAAPPRPRLGRGRRIYCIHTYRITTTSSIGGKRNIQLLVICHWRSIIYFDGWLLIHNYTSTKDVFLTYPSSLGWIKTHLPIGAAGPLPVQVRGATPERGPSPLPGVSRKNHCPGVNSKSLCILVEFPSCGDMMGYVGFVWSVWFLKDLHLVNISSNGNEHKLHWHGNILNLDQY